jgi:nucleotide-binding universal stress UspA family protein
MEIRNILVPTDFSDCSEHALTQALDLAERFDATVHVLHVINELDPDWYGLDDAQERAVELRQQIKQKAREHLQDLTPDDPNVEVNAKVSLQLSFDVAGTINEYIHERDIDLTVMGTHGRSTLERLMLGNVANKLVRHAPCPVITVREEVPWRSDTERVEMTDVLAPIDFSDHSRAALEAAKVFAAAHGATLHLLFVAEKRVVPTFSDTGVPGVGVVEMDDEIVRNAEQALEHLDARVPGPDVETEYRVAHGNVADQVIDYSETQGVDLIVMATRGLTGMQRFLLGSNTERIVRVAQCPVLTLPTTVDEDDPSDEDDSSSEATGVGAAAGS